MRLAVVFTSLLSLLVSTETGCCGPQISADQEAEAAPSVAKAREARGAGHLDAALEEIEQALGLAPGAASVWGERGKICYAIFTLREASGRGGLETYGFLEDARFSLERARSLGSRDSEALTLLARILRREGLLGDALKAAESALELSIDKATRIEALLESGRIRGAMLAGSREQGDPPREVVTRLSTEAAAAAAPLEEATSLDPGRAEAWVALSDVYALAGNEARELETLRRGLAARPFSELLHATYQDRLFTRNRAIEAAGFLAGLLRENPKNATARWFRARARMGRAEELRRENKDAEALGLYEEAVADWEEAARLRPAYTSSCNQAIAFARLGIATLLTGMGRLEQATETLVAAYKLWPSLFDQRDRFGVSYVSAMGEIGKTLLGGGRGFFGTEGVEGSSGRPATFKDRQASLRKAAAFHRLLIAMHPDRTDSIGYWYNNIGLALRDLGRLIAEEHAMQAGVGSELPEETRKVWEEALEAYDIALERLPEDPRIVNDCAVMFVYHLHRDFERAETLLLRATKLAQAELDAGGDDMSEQVRNFYEEAAGDAWENLGLLYLWHRQDPDQARPHLERALKFYPYGKRASARTLRSLPEPKETQDQEAALRPELPGLYWHAYLLPDAQGDEDVLARAKTLLEEAAGAASPSEALGICSEAVEILEEHLRKTGASAPALLLLGRALHGMARAETQSRRPDGLAVEGYLEEACMHLKKALERDRNLVEAHIELLEVELLRGRPGALEQIARDLAALIAERTKSMDPSLRNRATAMAGHCLYREYVRQKSAQTGGGGKADEKLAGLAADLLGRVYEAALAGKGRLEGVPSPQVIASDLSLLRQWQGKYDEAVKILDGWAKAAGPDATTLANILNAGRGGAHAEAVAAFASLLQKQRNDPTLNWYHGAALCEAGDEKRRVGDHEAALPLYDQAIGAMRKVIALEPGFAANSRTFIVRALSGKGFSARLQKKLGEAEAHFLAALKEDPSLRKTPDATNRNPADGVVFVADDLLKTGRADQAIKLYQKALELTPDEVTFSNNLALFARNLGASRQRQGSTKETQELFELSLWAYRNALKYAPEDVRLINDLALVMVYHVPRLMDEAEALLQRALSIGKAQLEVYPANDPAGKEALIDTLGDVLQNIGYIQMTVHRNLDAAEKAFQESLRHAPYDNRPAVRGHLATIRSVRAQIEAKKRAEEEQRRMEEEQRRKEEEERKQREETPDPPKEENR